MYKKIPCKILPRSMLRILSLKNVQKLQNIAPYYTQNFEAKKSYKEIANMIFF